MFIRPTNDTTYLTGNEGQNICGVFSENAPLQSYSASGSVRLLLVGHFTLVKTRMRIILTTWWKQFPEKTFWSFVSCHWH